MFKSYPLMARFLSFVLIPLLVVAIVSFLYLRGSLPVTDGRSIKAGVLQRAEITRDDNGAVTVKAATDHDAFFAIGFNHAAILAFQTNLVKLI